MNKTCLEQALLLLNGLEESENILIAGAGGGFDIFCGLPLFFALEQAGKKVTLANYSFSRFSKALARWGTTPNLLDVDADTEGDDPDYFPEKYLCQWFRHKRGTEKKLYAFAGNFGVVQLRAAYKAIIEKHKIDTLALVDGGTDSLLQGDEAGLGTPAEDMTSICAARDLPLRRKLLLSLGLGVDRFHGVHHSDVLAFIAKTIQNDGFLGALALNKNMPEVTEYVNACEFVFKRMPRKTSIVNTSIIDALNGNFGDYHSNERTHGSELYINPLMTIYWSFDLNAVADTVLYLDRLEETKSFEEVLREIKNFRDSYPLIKEPRNIPI